MIVEMRNPYLSFFRLHWELKKLVLQCALILPLTHIGLELLGLKRFFKLTEGLTSLSRKTPKYPKEEAHRDAQLFSAVARRFPLRLTCLERSTALCWLLRWRGVDAAVHLGVRKDLQSLDAHAWVQVGELVINDSDDITERYTRLSPGILRSQHN